MYLFTYFFRCSKVDGHRNDACGFSIFIDVKFFTARKEVRGARYENFGEMRSAEGVVGLNFLHLNGSFPTLSRGFIATLFDFTDKILIFRKGQARGRRTTPPPCRAMQILLHRLLMHTENLAFRGKRPNARVPRPSICINPSEIIRKIQRQFT